MNDLAIIEPLVLPDGRRPAALQPLPDWARLRLACVNVVWLNGNSVAQIPESMALPDAAKAMVLQHASLLSKHLERTPANSADAEAETLTVIAKLMLALPGQKATEESAEAKGEAYLAALDDVAPWAVSDAVRGWYRAEHGSKYNYGFAPAPGDLRTIALKVEGKVRARVKALENLVYAIPLPEFSEEHRAEMLKKLSGLAIELKGLDRPTPTQEAAE